MDPVKEIYASLVVVLLLDIQIFEHLSVLSDFCLLSLLSFKF